MSNAAGVICRKDLRDILRNKLFIGLLITLCVVVIISAVVSAISFHSQMADYQNYLTALKQAHSHTTPQPPQLFPLQLLIGDIEYLEIIGPLLAIIIGYGLIAKEKTRGTLQLLFSRPLGKLDMAFGKLGALATLWLGFCLLAAGVVIVVLLVIGGASLSATDLARLAITFGLVWIYLMFWSSLGLGLAGSTKKLPTALIAGLTIWLIIVLILPQIGDTMDPDNQVPGGLFNSLHVTSTQQQQVMSHFVGYESGRNYVETSSVEKHFERSAFGFTGIKNIYNQQPVSYVAMRLWPNMLAVGLWAAGAVLWAMFSCNKRQLLRKEQ